VLEVVEGPFQTPGRGVALRMTFALTRGTIVEAMAVSGPARGILPDAESEFPGDVQFLPGIRICTYDYICIS
jgi:hypothetical protein